jgi:hypothetical protein
MKAHLTCAVLAFVVMAGAVQNAFAQATQPAAGDEAQLVNIRIEISVSEQDPGAQATRKAVTLTVADRQSGSVRSLSAPRPAPEGGGPTRLNVDVFPIMRRDGRVQTQVTLDYGQQGRGTSVKVEPLLESGKVLIVSQATDPASDRRTVVEITATVLK